jgi:LysM repeat protein
VAEVTENQKNILTHKIAGKVPVWVAALGGLILAWLYAKWRSNKAAAADTAAKADTASATDAQSEQVAPQFIIENNMPAGVGAPTTPSEPVTVPPAPPPVTTPPGTTPNPPVITPTKPVTPGKPAPKPAKKPPVKYIVKHGDTLSAIAKKYKTTTAKLWTYNTTPGNRPAATIKTLKARGQNLLYAGETILIPQ